MTVGTEMALELLATGPGVELVEKNYILHATELPDDTSFSSLWGLNNIGQTEQIGGVADCDIDAPEAWDISTGSGDIVVAVLDGGIDYNHEDLEANIWTNSAELNGASDYDDDGNGLVDDIHGYDFVDGDGNPMDDGIDSHGTHVAGIVGARGNNGTGVTGVCWSAKLMAVRNLDSEGLGYLSDTINAIDYAVENGARIINASYGGYYYPGSSLEKAAITRALEAGVLFIAAAGNGKPPYFYDGVDINSDPFYPASYDLDNIISVLATTHNDNKGQYSNFGSYAVDLGGPGGTLPGQVAYNILSTVKNDSYTYKRGTSMATPYVSGTAALLWGYRPSIDWWQAKTIILKSADYLSSLSTKCRTSARLNAYNALTYTVPTLPGAPTDLIVTAYENGGLYDLELEWVDNSSNETGFRVYSKVGTGAYAQLAQVGANVTSYWITELPGGSTWSFYVRAYRTDGESIKTETVNIKIQ
jgi:subtilisin family serine protease